MLQDTQDFQAAFANAVQKRVQYAIHPMFIGLSSGYDSGAIHVALVQDRTNSANRFCFSKSSSCNFLQGAALLSHVKSMLSHVGRHIVLLLLPTDPILRQIHSREANLLCARRTGHFAYTVHSTEDMEILKQRIDWAGNWTETNVIVSWLCFINFWPGAFWRKGLL